MHRSVWSLLGPSHFQPLTFELSCMSVLVVCARLAVKIFFEFVDVGTRSSSSAGKDVFFRDEYGKWSEELNCLVFYVPIGLMFLCHLAEGFGSHTYRVICRLRDSRQRVDFIEQLKAGKDELEQ